MGGWVATQPTEGDTTISPATPIEEVIESRIEIHDKNQLELKLDYSIAPEQRVNCYQVESYFFIPTSLGINENTYSKRQFYNDIQNYIRFRTPDITLDALLDSTNPTSPLSRVRDAISRSPHPGYQRDDDTLIEELKLFGCQVRGNLRDHATLVTPEETQPDIDRPETMLRLFLEKLERVIAAYRALEPDLRKAIDTSTVLDAYGYIDEYISLSTERYLLYFLEELNRNDSAPGKTDALTGKIAEMLIAEDKHRKNRNYPRISDDPEMNERYIHRRSVLKKFTMSALFLEFKKNREGDRIADLGAAGAAGIAMIFATAAAIYSQQRYGTNTLPFVAALVVSYILKDRIKDWLKHYFSRKMTRWLSDYNLKVIDPRRRRTLGKCREAFAFVSQHQIPADVLQCRHPEGPDSIEALSKPESVMKYEKDIELNAAVISSPHARRNDINDIIRFNISSLLLRADDSQKNVAYYHPDARAIARIDCRKVYHLNVVLVLSTQETSRATVTKRVRIVMDRMGITRIEDVEPAAPIT